MRPSAKLLSFATLVVLLVACGDGGNPLADKLAGAGAEPTPSLLPTPSPTPTPAGPNAMIVAGDITLEDRNPDVAVVPDEVAGADDGRLRIEVRHRPQGSSQADSILVLDNVPARAGTYRLSAPEEPPVTSRVYAWFTSRGEAVGSMKDFNTAVAGSLTLDEKSPGALLGSYQFAAQEPPPPPPPTPTPGQIAPPVVGTIPPEPPKRVQISGTLLVTLPQQLATPTATPNP